MMAMTATLELDVVAREVTLQYPGAEGVVFRDAVLVIHNTGVAPATGVGLQCLVTNEGRVLVDRQVDLTPLGFDSTLEPGREGSSSFFRLLQQVVKGFGSKVNMFGYRAALNWTYQLVATPTTGPNSAPAGAERKWQVRWHPSETDADLVEVDITSV